MKACRGKYARERNQGIGGRLIQAASFLIHVATDAFQLAPNFLGAPDKEYSRGNDGIWRDEHNTCFYDMNDGELCTVKESTWWGYQPNDDLLTDPDKFVPCQFDEFHPAAL